MNRATVSDLREEMGPCPTVFYGWQKKFFENGAAAFQPQECSHRQVSAVNDGVRSELRRKAAFALNVAESRTLV